MARKATIPPRERAILASAAQIDLGDSKEAARLRRRSGIAWQKDAWGMYDAVSAVKYGTNFIGGALSKVMIHAATLNPSDPTATPAPVTDGPAADAVDRLRGPLGSHSGMLREFGIHLSVPGECYLIGVAKRGDEPEDWGIRSTEEFGVTADGRWELELDDGRKIQLKKDQDFVLRVWINHPRKASEADSPLRGGVLSACEELLRLDRMFAAEELSRAVQAGILFVPEEFSFGPADPTSDEGDGQIIQDPFMRDFTNALITAIQNPGTAAAVAPYVVRGKAQFADALKHIQLTRPLEEIFNLREERALRRIAQGINLPPEVLEGIKGVNHWGAWQIEESTFKAHIEPLLLVVMDALTEGYLRPWLRSEGVVNPEQYVVWYDASRLIARPNRQEDAKGAHKDLVISDEALRRVLDFDDADAPDDAELARRIVQSRGLVDPMMVQEMIRTLDPSLHPMPNGSTPNGSPNGSGPNGSEPSPAGPGDERNPPVLGAAIPKGRNLGRALAEVDRNLRDRLHTAAELGAHRALQRAGNRVASAASRKKDRSVAEVAQYAPRANVCAMLGESVVAAVGLTTDELLEGSFSDFGARYESWVRRAQRQALGIVGIGEDDSGWDALTAQQDTDRREAWAWTLPALIALITERLWTPSPVTPTLGEMEEGMTVPYGIVRASVARAGGMLAESVTIGPIGGIGSGRLVLDALQERGGAIEAYEWEYGVYPRDRGFEPHEMLDGIVFTNFDDDRLANLEGWPPTDFFTPGDHDGCRCNQIPVILSPSEAAEVLEASAR